MFFLGVVGLLCEQVIGWKEMTYYVTSVTLNSTHVTFTFHDLLFESETRTGTVLLYDCWPLIFTWPHLNSDVGLEEGEY